MIDDHRTIALHAWVKIARDCTVKHEIVGTSGASFTIAGNPEPFEIYFDTEALRTFVEHGTIALADLDAKTGRSGTNREDNPG